MMTGQEYYDRFIEVLNERLGKFSDDVEVTIATDLVKAIARKAAGLGDDLDQPL